LKESIENLELEEYIGQTGLVIAAGFNAGKSLRLLAKHDPEFFIAIPGVDNCWYEAVGFTEGCFSTVPAMLERGQEEARSKLLIRVATPPNPKLMQDARGNFRRYAR